MSDAQGVKAESPAGSWRYFISTDGKAWYRAVSPEGWSFMLDDPLLGWEVALNHPPVEAYRMGHCTGRAVWGEIPETLVPLLGRLHALNALRVSRGNARPS